MWVVAKYKLKELNLLKKKFRETLGESLDFYIPKIRYQKNIKNKVKFFEKFIMEGYLFCHHSQFSDIKILHSLKNTKGLSYFLNDSKNNQNEINCFVDYCKRYENKEGYITQGFFNDDNIKKGKFLEGPFANIVFDIISRNKNKLKILIGNIETTISKNSNYLYRSI